MPNSDQTYCDGIVTTKPVPAGTYVISGSDSDEATVWSEGNLVFLNRGADQGVKVGDEFLVSRPISDPVKIPWFTGQESLTKAMGTTYEDEGRLRVVAVQKTTATAQVTHACNYIQRGDIAQPFSPRPAPSFKAERLDTLAQPNGKAKAMIVTTRGFGETAGTDTIVYVNLGSVQGVKVGDYFRVFRYQGNDHQVPYQTAGTQYELFGFGSTPRPYTVAELPREILGEGMVLRVAPNAATVLITHSERELYVGDYVELE